jgi:hypothetical protein
MTRLLPAHPYHPGLGGVKVLVDNQQRGQCVLAVFDRCTDEPVAWAAHDWATPPTRHKAVHALVQGRLHDMFPDPDIGWYLGRLWEAEVTIAIEALEHDLTRGNVTIHSEEESHEFPWIGRLVHTAGGLMWRYDLIAWPKSVDPLDVVFLGRVCEIFDGLRKGGIAPAATRQTLTSVWQGAPPYVTGVPFLVASGDNIWVKYLRRCTSRADALAEAGQPV